METLFYDPTTTDLGGLVARALELRKQANDEEARGFGVYVAASGEALTSLITALRGQGFSASGDHVFASSALAHPQILGQLGGMAEGVYLTMTPYDPTSADEPMVSFAAAFEAKYNEVPDYWAAHGYDAVKVFVQAIREGGVALPSEFRTGMRSVTDLTGVTGSIQFRETGDAQKYMRVYLISNGATREYEDYMKRRRQEITDRRRELQQRMKEIESRLRQPPG
jgi:ABC-type branched-subunit amino acid transport system substrate-binding protein